MREEKISAGNYELNKFLFGGYETDIITTIYGPGGSGKTNICMIACTSLAKKGGKVIYMDSEGGFSVDRFKQIHAGEKEDVEKSLSNVLILKPTSFKEQEKDFEKMLTYVKKGNVSLIIIDSIAMLYRLELGDAITSRDMEKISAVNRRLARHLRVLNEISRKQNIPVIVTNQVYSNFVLNNESEMDKKISMVGGDLLKYWSKCLIEIQNYGGRRKLILRKHRSLPNKELSFEIINSGIRKRGIF